MVTSLKECPKSHAGVGRQETSRSAVLLDSEPVMLEILARFLDPVGVSAVSRQTTAAGALDAVREHCPDLLLLDLALRRRGPQHQRGAGARTRPQDDRLRRARC